MPDTTFWTRGVHMERPNRPGDRVMCEPHAHGSGRAVGVVRDLALGRFADVPHPILLTVAPRGEPFGDPATS